MTKRCRRSGRSSHKRANKKKKGGRTLPRATVSLEPQHEDLKSCPGGFVEIRRMSYGELMTSQDLAYQVQMKATAGSDEPEMGFNISRATVTEYQFKTCIRDHNLEDESGRKLDFTKKHDVHLLDGNVGQEVQNVIDDMHNWNKQLPNSDEPSSNGSSRAETAMAITRPVEAPPTAGNGKPAPAGLTPSPNG